MLQDLKYEKNDKIVAIARIEQKLIRSGILNKYLQFVLKKQLNA